MSSSMAPPLAAGIDLWGALRAPQPSQSVGGLQPDAGLLDLVAGPELRSDDGDARIVQLLLRRRPGVVAIDAPLTLPHAVTCSDPECSICFATDGRAPSYGSRALDRAEAWAEVGHTERPPMPMVMVAGIALRALYLRRLLERAGLTVIETWPMGVYRVLARSAGPAASDTNDAWRRGLLAERVAGLQRVDAGNLKGPMTDRLDAVAAAYAGWCQLTGQGR